MKRSLLKVIAILSCTVPPISAVLLYFPLWREMGAEAALCGFTVLLLILCMIPFFSTIKRALSSPSATTMWLMFFLIFGEGAFRQAGETVEPLVYHVPHAHGQVVPVSAGDGATLKAVAVVGAGLLTGAVVAALPHLLQKLLLDLPALFVTALLIQLILQNGQFIAVDLHGNILLFQNSNTCPLAVTGTV